MKDNKHAQLIPPAVLAEAQEKIDEVNRILAHFVVALTPEERHGMAKMGEKTIGFVEKAYSFAVQNPKLVPPYLDMDDFTSDFTDAHGLWTLANSIRQLDENINDTQMSAGSEAYQAALVFYHSVKTAASQDVPGAKAVYQELKTRFPGGRRRSANGQETGNERS